MRAAVLTLAWLCGVAAQLAGSGAAVAQGPLEDSASSRGIAGLLVTRCLTCHAGSAPEGGLDLTHPRTMFTGGRGGPAVVAGDAEASLIWKQVDSGKMPPDGALSADERAILRRWIEAGAPWEGPALDPFAFTTDRRAGYDWWSLQPLRQAPPPTVERESWPRNEIDRFVLAALEAAGLEPSREAPPRLLVRRLYFDLIGLPPPARVIDAFAAEPSDAAYERLVDDLLASPHHGERWGRHWLDVVRFGESDGFENNFPRREFWHYRDWVIDALNQDMPYDRFARMQLAGDVIEGGYEGAAAAGFLVAGVHNTVVGASDRMKRQARQDEVEEVLGTIGQTFLGLTLHCARCHDHKFDPVTATEYYRLAAAIDGVNHGKRRIEEDDGADRPAFEVYTVAPRDPPEPMRLYLRGDVGSPGEVVAPGAPAAIAGLSGEFGLPPDAGDGPRRVALARFITDPSNVLFARVIVNRIWHYHFGVGIVDTPGDLGFGGGRPTHPELLDWLARWFQDGGYRLKPLHRLMVTSATYRQASRADEQALAVDAGNRLLWRYPPRRLEAEALRDTILEVAGALNRQRGGPGYWDVREVYNDNSTWYEPIDVEGEAFDRRTIYRFNARGGRSAMLDAFDCPDASVVASRRAVTITPLQALSLSNSDFVLRMADRMARRVVEASGDDATAQVEAVYRLAYGRAPLPPETQLARGLIRDHGLATLCRAIFNSNEFVIIE